MKYLEEFRNPGQVRLLLQQLSELVTGDWNIMEICGGQTHAFLRYGIDELLPKKLTLLHGPGCPVCVTPVEKIDKAIDIAARQNVIFCSFGDMLRVPGSSGDLLSARAKGADVRMVYSPMDAVEIARDNPTREVVFFAVGFETTAPAIAMAAKTADALKLANFTLLVSHVLVPPAIDALLSDEDNRIDGFLAAGHVCTVMGYHEYLPLAQKYKVPIVVTGFEPVDLLQGLLMCARLLEQGEWGVANQYTRSVTREGNRQAQQAIGEVFEVCDQTWRGIGTIPNSGLKLAPEYAHLDAEQRFEFKIAAQLGDSVCISGLVLQGKKKPTECPAFARECDPEHPLGATMVSSEGACAAYYRYRKD